MKTRLLSFAILACSIVFVYGQCPSYTTTNTQTGTCNEPAGNINYSGAGAITLTVNGNLTINGDFAVLGETLIVNGTLTVTGAFSSGGGSTVTIGNGGTINSNSLASGFGAVFTVGNGGTLNVTNDAGTGLFAAFTVESGGSVDVGGNFITGGIGSATIDGNMNVDGDFTNAGGGVLNGGGTLTVGGTYTNGGDDSGYSGTFNGAPLPVELVFFNGENINDDILLTWQTAAEINNDGFEIERSGDGEHFSVVGWVNGHGNTNQIQNYSYMDSRPYPGLTYYRLRQVDFDGQFEYSPTIRVESDNILSALEVYPNPTFGAIRIHNDISHFQLFDPSGKLILQRSSSTRSEAEALISKKLQESPIGVYTLSAGFGSRVDRIRLVKK